MTLFSLVPLAAFAQTSALPIVGTWQSRDKNWGDSAPIRVSADKISLPECPSTNYKVVSDRIETNHWVLKGEVRVLIVEFDRAPCPRSENRISFQVPLDSPDQKFIVVSRYPFVADGKTLFGASSMYHRLKDKD